MHTNEQDLLTGLITVSQANINSSAGNASKPRKDGRRVGDDESDDLTPAGVYPLRRSSTSTPVTN